jgi:hypothetical protein
VSEECRKCGKGPVHRLQSAPGFQFKGTGWYVTDYAQKGKSGGESSAGKSSSSDGDKSDAKKSDSGSSDSSSKSDSAASSSSTPAPAAKD